MPNLVLVVNGAAYSGWKSIRVTRSIETIAGSFALQVSDRWGEQQIAWPIREEDHCIVRLDTGETSVQVIEGYIDKRSLSLSPTERSLSYSGRDKAGALVDCSAIVAEGSVGKAKWTFHNVDVFKVATEIAKPFGISVSVQPGLEGLLAKEAKIVLHPGDSCFDVISRIAGAAGVLVVSDAHGGIVITRAGTGRATALVEGANVMTASVEHDAADRFHRYLISSQIPRAEDVDDDDPVGDANVQAEAFDLGVRRQDRVILIRPDKGYGLADSKRRADWEARIRAAKAERVTVGVQGWTQPFSDVLWPINALTLVSVPSIGINGDMLISQVEYSISNDGGEVTQIHLVRPDAFTPEPRATVSASTPWLISVGGELKEPRQR